MDKYTENKNIESAQRQYPGVAVNEADADRENPKLQKQDVFLLNNNPRTSDSDTVGQP